MSEDNCDVHIVGPSTNAVCTTLVSLAAERGRLSFGHHGLQIEAGDLAMAVRLDSLAAPGGLTLTRLSIDGVAADLLDLAELSRRLGCAMLVDRSFSRGIDWSCTQVFHRGELVYDESSTPDAERPLRYPALDIDLPDVSPEDLPGLRARIHADLIARLGEPVAVLLRGWADQWAATDAMHRQMTALRRGRQTTLADFPDGEDDIPF